MDLRFSEVRVNREMRGTRLLVEEAIRWLTAAAAILLIPVLFINLFHLYTMRTGSDLARASYELLMELYQPLLIARFLLLLGGVGYLFFTVFLMKRKGKTVHDLFTPAYLACLLVIVGEVMGRFLFYAAHIRIGL